MKKSIGKTKNWNNNILLIAYACEPFKGSEAEVGLQWSKMIAEIVKDKGYLVYVLTRANNKESLEKILHQLPENLNFIYYDTPKWLRFWKKKSRGALLYYLLWQIGGIIHIKTKYKHLNFKIIHHITFVNDYLPPLFIFIKKGYTTFIWGPIGSNPPIPVGLANSLLTIIKDRTKYYAKVITRILNPVIWYTMIKTDYIIVISHKVQERLLKYFPFIRDKIFLIRAIDILPPFNSPRISQKKDFKILFAGNFIPIKMPHLVILGFYNFLQKSDAKDVQLLMVGKGPMEKDLKKIVNNLGIQKNVKFISWMPREELDELYEEVSILVFPSFEEGGMVVREAMRKGVIPVVFECTENGTILKKEELNDLLIPCHNDHSKTVIMIANIFTALRENQHLLKKQKLQKKIISIFNEKLNYFHTQHLLADLYKNFL